MIRQGVVVVPVGGILDETQIRGRIVGTEDLGGDLEDDGLGEGLGNPVPLVGNSWRKYSDIVGVAGLDGPGKRAGCHNVAERVGANRLACYACLPSGCDLIPTVRAKTFCCEILRPNMSWSAAAQVWTTSSRVARWA